MHPQEIVNDASAGVITLIWEDGTPQQLDHALLRHSCRCAGCSAQRLRDVVPALDPDAVRVQEIVPVGLYAVQLIFGDGHARGIFPWRYLRDLGGDAPKAVVAA